MLIENFSPKMAPAEARKPGSLLTIAGNGSSESLLVRELKEALRATREDLQTSIGRLEKSNSDLKISNERIIAINDELERSQEELQSLHEELTTVHQQLQSKLSELESSNADILNLRASSEIATICLDADYRIKWFTPEASALFNVQDADIGLDMRDFHRNNLGTGLIEETNYVLKSLAPKQRELNGANNSLYLRRILPYRTVDGRGSGVVITYTDITEARKAAEGAAAAQKALSISLEAHVRERTTRLRMLTAELTLTEERERRQLAQDLHDGLGQLLAILKIKLTSIKKSERRGAFRGALREIENLIDQSNQSVRALMLQLSPPVLQALGLVPALEWLTEEMERVYGLSVQVNSDGAQIALNEPEKTTIFRAVRELLINVSKHTECKAARIDCACEGGRLTISVTDEGGGFFYVEATAPQSVDSGFGLASIKDRIEYVGGEMSINSEPGRGTCVTIAFPRPHSEQTIRRAV